MNWLVGLIFSLGIGHVVTALFLKCLRRYMKLGKKPGPKTVHRPVPPWLMGTCERIFFTMAVGFDLPGTAVGMMVWLTLKMVTHWNRAGFDLVSVSEGNQFKRIRFAQSAALTGLISMTFALTGGLICDGKIPWLTEMAFKWAL